MYITRAAASAAEEHKRQQRVAAAGTLRGRRVEGIAIEHGGAFGPKLETICTKLCPSALQASVTPCLLPHNMSIHSKDICPKKIDVISPIRRGP
jgi:hypothetical protein